MRLIRGVVALDTSASVVYFNTPHTSKVEGQCYTLWAENDLIHAYHIKEDKWTQLPGCCRDRFGLAVIGGFLTAVGGRQNTSNSQPSQSLDTLISFRGGKWIEQLPTMLSKHIRPVVVTTHDHKYVIVAGAGVEILDCASLQWSNVCDRLKLTPCSAAVDDSCILIFDGLGGAATCKIDDLLSSSQKTVTDASSPAELSGGDSGGIWQRLPYLPVDRSSPGILCGQLVSVGGVDNSFEANEVQPNYIAEQYIYQFNTGTNSWMCIGFMQLARESCMVVVLPPGDRLLVAGGTNIVGRDPSYTMEQATVSSIVNLQ